MSRDDLRSSAGVAPDESANVGGLMTVRDLAGRTGMSRKAIRQLESLRLIYSAGRSDANYRLYNESALWCVGVVRELRSLGLTLREIQQLATVYLKCPDEPIEQHLARLLDDVEHRIEDRLRELETIRDRIIDYRRKDADAT